MTTQKINPKYRKDVDAAVRILKQVQCQVNVSFWFGYKQPTNQEQVNKYDRRNSNL